jgi:hypothetical protein
VLSSLKVEDEDGRFSVSSLKFSTRSSIRPNCLLIRLVRGVVFKGKRLLGLFDTNRSAYEDSLSTETTGRSLVTHAASSVLVLVYTQCIDI